MWPSASFCCECFSKTTFEKMDCCGTIKEMSLSFIGGRKEVYGIIEMGGIRVIGSLSQDAAPGGKVHMVECGIRDDGCFFCRFESIPQ